MKLINDHKRPCIRLLPLTCLAPDIVEAILDGHQPKGLGLGEMLGNGPLGWEEQRMGWGFRCPERRRGVRACFR